jgi:hypothetical protein
VAVAVTAGRRVSPDKEIDMGKFQDLMDRKLRILGLAESTRQSYLEKMRHFMRPPDELTVEDVKQYQLFLTKERRVSWSTFNVHVCAIRFFYRHVLPVTWEVEHIPCQKTGRRLPVVLSSEEGVALLDTATNLKHRADKTRLLPFRRPPVGQKSGTGSASFDFLGFTLYWARSRSGRWGMACKTRRASLRRAIQSVTDWCRRHRHLPVKEQHEALTRRLRGHFNYFGVSGNFRSLLLLVEAARRAWYKWLCRRSQRKRLNWERFADLLEQLPLPRPRITVRIWGP